jgi:hypothetical protein
LKISRDATFDEHHRHPAVPDEISTPPSQSINPTSSIQIQVISPLPRTEYTQNAPEKPANDLMVEEHVPVEPSNQQEESTIASDLEASLEPPLLPAPESPQKPQLRVSARGRIPIRE